MALILLATALCGGLDQQMSDGIRRGWRSPTMDAVMSAATQPGGDYAVAGSGVAFCLFGRPELRQAAALATCSYLGATAVLVGVRAVVNRPRPDDANPGWLGSAFPSGHAASYFATATVYALKFPKLAPFLGMAGAMVAVSRVYLGRHWPSDVLAGALLGTGAGLLTMRIEKPISRFLRLEDSRLSLLPPGGGGLNIVTFRF